MTIITPTASVEKLKNQLSIVIDNVAVKDSVTIRFSSDRNRVITRHTDVSPLAPDSYVKGHKSHALVWGAEAPPQVRDIFYPALDLDLRTMPDNTVAEMVVPGAKLFTMNSWKTEGHFNADLSGRALIPLSEMEHWENWVLAVGPMGQPLGAGSFAVIVRPVATDGRVELLVDFLGNDWSGAIEIDVIEPTELITTLSFKAQLRDAKTYDPATGALSVDMGNTQPRFERTSEALEADLGLCLDFMLAAQNTTPGSPYEKGLYLFYDVDGGMWRTPNWTWTWGPSIMVALEAVAVAPSLASRADRLREFALELGELSLGVVIDNPGHPSDGMGVARWDPLPEVRRGSEKFASLADPLVLAGWAWGRLYDATGDQRYIDAMRALAGAAERQIKQFGVVQQDWLFERERWLERILDEAGFGTEGLAELHRLTDDDAIAKLTSAYLDPLLDRLERDDGLWDRFWYVETEARTPSENMIRGLGWAMQGLLGAYAATGKPRYLDAANKMAGIVLDNQRDDGSWTFEFHRPASEVGHSDKGTPLWSLLLYRLHEITGNERQLEGARAAMEWSRGRLRRNSSDEGRGGIVGVGPQSGIAYRPWFRQCCTYSTAFTAAAIIFELKQAGNGHV